MFVPNPMTTDKGGPSARLRVDVGSTDFFAGREFRTFYEFSLATATSIWFKATLPLDIILQGLGVQLDDGHVHLESYAGATPAGSFATPLPVFGLNRMASRPQPYYESQVTFTTGGYGVGWHEAGHYLAQDQQQQQPGIDPGCRRGRRAWPTRWRLLPEVEQHRIGDRCRHRARKVGGARII